MFYSSIPKIQSLNGYEVFSVSPRHHIKQSCEVRVYTGACVGLIHGHRANPHPWGLGETYPYKTAVSGCPDVNQPRRNKTAETQTHMFSNSRSPKDGRRYAIFSKQKKNIRNPNPYRRERAKRYNRRPAGPG